MAWSRRRSRNRSRSRKKKLEKEERTEEEGGSNAGGGVGGTGIEVEREGVGGRREIVVEKREEGKEEENDKGYIKIREKDCVENANADRVKERQNDGKRHWNDLYKELGFSWISLLCIFFK